MNELPTLEWTETPDMKHTRRYTYVNKDGFSVRVSILADPRDGDDDILAVVATARLNDIELGTGVEIGLECDIDDPRLIDVAWEMVDVAIENAIKHWEELQVAMQARKSA